MTPRLLKQVFGSLLIAVLALGGATAHLLTAEQGGEKGHAQLLTIGCEAPAAHFALRGKACGDNGQMHGLPPLTIQQVLWIQIEMTPEPKMPPIALKGEGEEQRSRPVAEASCAKRASAIARRCGEPS